MDSMIEQLLAERGRSRFRLRFTGDLEARYRADLRKLLRLTRVVLFMVIGLAFAIAPFQEVSLFNAPREMRGSLLLLAQTVTPTCLAAAALTYLRAPGFLTQGFQISAVVMVLVAVLALRFFDLLSMFRFPVGMVGLAAIAVAVFGGFSWYPLCVAIVGFFSLAILQEYAWTFSGEPPALHAYQLSIAFVIALAGSFSNEVLRRQNWLQKESATATARVDMLTGLSNRSDFERRMQLTLRQARREQCAVAVMMLDVDHFKKINDQYGHAAGDQALRAVGQTLNAQCAQRPLDITARTGGEEFNVVWYGVTPEVVPMLAQRTLEAIRGIRLKLHRVAEPLALTASVGVCWAIPGESTTTHALVQRADELMYQAKAGGRNRACLGEFQHPADAAEPNEVAGTH